MGGIGMHELIEFSILRVCEFTSYLGGRKIWAKISDPKHLVGYMYCPPSPTSAADDGGLFEFASPKEKVMVAGGEGTCAVLLLWRFPIPIARMEAIEGDLLTSGGRRSGSSTQQQRGIGRI
jgi:hypothetical protein